MPPKRTRKAAEAEASKSSMEDAAVALAGVEGALKTTTATATATGKRKASGAATNKRSPKKAAAKRERSNSLEQLTEVAASLLTDNPTDEDLSVPNPMATAAAAAAAAPAPMPSLPPAKNGGEQPTGFRKKAAARPKAAVKKETKGNGEEGKKTQIQYNPDVPMSKEQLTAWRREMRRVRNRESAAASRRKVRDRIQELEQEVKCWKDRYEEVMARLAQAEGKKEDEANV